jgi:hypothetical protein
MLRRGYARRLCCCGGYADATAAMPRRRGGYAAATRRLCGAAGLPAWRRTRSQNVRLKILSFLAKIKIGICACFFAQTLPF